MVKKHLSSEQMVVVRKKAEKENFARLLRNNKPLPELIFAKMFKGWGFYSQKIICGWIVDFYYPAGRIIIEIDGESHANQKELDALKNNRWRELNYFVIRFSNEDVLNNQEYVIETTVKAIEFRTVFCIHCKQPLTINEIVFNAEIACFGCVI